MRVEYRIGSWTGASEKDGSRCVKDPPWLASEHRTTINEKGWDINENDEPDAGICFGLNTAGGHGHAELRDVSVPVEVSFSYTPPIWTVEFLFTS
jgi:hypothetical protein